MTEVPTPFNAGIAVTLSAVAAPAALLLLPLLLLSPVELLLQAETEIVSAAATAAPATGSRSVFREFLIPRIRTQRANGSTRQDGQSLLRGSGRNPLVRRT